TGLLGGLLAQGMVPLRAASAAAFLHGRAGDIARERLGERSMIAGDILLALSEAFQQLQVLPLQPALGVPVRLW
ncbi:MAG: hypothetical protein ACM3YF_07470, partial [Candidatus Zixiibacteriota bacterium]